MDKETLRLVIVDQRKSIEEKFRDKNIIVRDASKSIVLKAPTAFIVLGVRRAGKSTLSEQLFTEDKFGYINFDDERLLGATKDDLNVVLQVFYELYGSSLRYIPVFIRKKLIKAERKQQQVDVPACQPGRKLAAKQFRARPCNYDLLCIPKPAYERFPVGY